ncbi:uncharacterized protein LOC112205025 [Pan troglodytes]|uniref:uncharacterized protein LOC112205025 n=1 Tax=Pan troglodytes TaxID=9598 RepID=UPI0023EFB89F|nr:uncharacterized protein LOC112205025 [Pan troglodytes]
MGSSCEDELALVVDESAVGIRSSSISKMKQVRQLQTTECPLGSACRCLLFMKPIWPWCHAAWSCSIHVLHPRTDALLCSSPEGTKFTVTSFPFNAWAVSFLKHILAWLHHSGAFACLQPRPSGSREVWNILLQSKPCHLRCPVKRQRTGAARAPGSSSPRLTPCASAISTGGPAWLPVGPGRTRGAGAEPATLPLLHCSSEWRKVVMPR